MECNIEKEKAFRAKETAEKRFAKEDFAGAKKYAVKAQKLYPELEGISQMLATFDVYVASQVQINGETDFYSVLGLNPLADEDTVKKQYGKLALMLHPDKNRTVGAEGAFKLVSEAWTLLSDNVKRTSYDLRRNRQSSTVVNPTNSAIQNTKVNGCLKSNISHNRSKLRTFWTVCTSCQVQYEYLRKYVNKRLSCKNCRRTFMAVEREKPSENNSVPLCSWSFLPENVHGNHGFNGVTYFPASTILLSGNGFTGFHSGVGYEYPNMAFQWSPFPGTPAAGFAGVHGQTAIAPSPSPAPSAGSIHQPNGNNVKRDREKVNAAAAKDRDKDRTENGSVMVATISGKSDKHEKKRKADEGTSMNGYQEGKRTRTVTSETKTANGAGKVAQDAKKLSEASNRRISSAPAFDARQLLIDKARTEIRKKLEEMKFRAAAAAVEKANGEKKNEEQKPARVDADQGVRAVDSKTNKPRPGSIPITVPDPDFHDFDKDRLEECFKPKQIWAIYDEEDGMPRLYCLIRQVISLKPFKIRITYLNSKTDTEFGSVNWIDSGFVKACGHFRAWETEDVGLVNIFSHVLQGAKAGRGGCIRIFPKRGEIWAVYRNWSPDWNSTTPDEVRHHYEMVEVLDDYNEDLGGICITPLIKLDGFKTVYLKNADQKAVRWIPRREMLQFSHQVPSWLLQGEVSANLPDGCWDLDPAATPEELLHGTNGDKPEPVPTN